MAQAQPQQYLFVSRRDFMLRTTQGQCLTFQKGVPTHVPKGLHSFALEKGLLPCDTTGKEVDVEAAAEVMPVEIKKVMAPELAEDRTEAVLAAMKELVKRNNSKDFGGNAMPTIEALTLALGWQVDMREIRKVWNDNRQMLLTGKKTD